MVGSGWVFDDGRETMDDGQKQPYILIAPNYGRWAFVVSGLWSVVCGLRSVVCGLSSVVCRLSSVVCRLWSVVCRPSSLVCRLWSLVPRLIYPPPIKILLQ